MAKLLKLRRGSTAQHASFTGAEGEVTIDTTKDTAVVHDGAQAGGRPLLREDMSNLPAGTIDNADINASAAIAGTKIAPNFGTQAIDAGALTITGGAPTVTFTDNDNNPDYKIITNGGAFLIHDSTNGTDKIKILNGAEIDITPNVDFANGIDVTGAITATGNLTANGDVFVSSAYPRIHLTDTNNNSDYLFVNDNGNFRIFDDTNSAARLSIDASGTTNIAGNLDVGAGVDVTGIITSTGKLQINSTAPHIELMDSDDNPDFRLVADSGNFQIYDISNAANRFQVNSDGHVDITGNLDVGAGVDVTGNITVSGTVDGRDVATDGTKLDGIESGATADQTDAQIASALSGQNVFVTASNAVGFSSNDKFTASANTHIDVIVNGSNEFRFESDGDFHADGDVIAQSTTISSDINLKENIKVVPDALDKVESLRGVTFDWKRDGTPSAGVIAQEVQGVLPEAVKEVTPVKGGDSHLSVNYHALTSILIEAIKELKAEVEELKGGK